MKNKHIINLFFIVYAATLLNLVWVDENYSMLPVAVKYSVFLVFLIIFVNRASQNLIVYKASTLDRLLLLLFVYNFVQSLILGALYSGAFKIIFGHLFITMIQSRQDTRVNTWQFYKAFHVIFILLVITHIYYFIQDPFATGFRLVRVDIGGLNGNEIAGIFTTMFPFSLFLIQNRYPRHIRKATLVFLFLYLYLLIFYNGSRFAIFSSVLSAFVIFYYMVLRSKGNRIKVSLGRIAAVVLVFVLGFIFAGESLFGKDEFFSKKLSEVASGEHQEGNLAGRIGGIWVPLVEYVNQNSFWLGFGNESVRDITAKTTFWVDERNQVVQYSRDVHNFFVTFYVELGAAGLLIFLSIFVIIIVRLVTMMRRESEHVTMQEKIMVLCSFIGFTTWLLTANSWYSGGWFILFFYVYFLNQINTRQVKPVTKV